MLVANLYCTSLSENQDLQSLLKELIEELKGHYLRISACVGGKSEDNSSDGENNGKFLSSILISKVLLGTLGCAPGYDKFFITGIKIDIITSSTFNIKSLVKLAKFYVRNKDVFEAKRASMKTDGELPYPQMRLLDMMFWSCGKKKCEEEKAQSGSAAD